MDQDPDAALIAASVETPVAFATLFDRHYDFVHRYIGRRAGPDLADDLASETFTTAFRVRSSYDLAHSDARPWLLGIATNLVRHHRRAEARRLGAYERLEVARAVGIEEDPVVARADAAVARLRIARALARIPNADRDALLLLAWADLTYPEIARALGIPIGTVRSRIHRARQRLRELLDPTGQSLFADTITEVMANDG